MNDRAVSIFEQYELQILRTWKGRGAILCETDQGIRILKEYNGPKERIYLQQKLLKEIKNAGFSNVEEILSNKEGEPFCVDMDRVTYIVKTYVDARECNLKDEKETLKSLQVLSGLHHAMKQPGLLEQSGTDELPLLYEFEKRNKELRKVRKYLKEKKQKTEFESYLQRNYEYFFAKAIAVTEEFKQYPLEKWYKELMEEGTFCHGDYQYHNILMAGEEVHLINFEKISLEDQTKDLYLFTRKLLEKNSWDIDLGQKLIEEYNRYSPLTVSGQIQFLYRFLYPEKFWKVVNFYYNNTKSFIPARNKEKLDKILMQEEKREIFFDQVLRKISN